MTLEIVALHDPDDAARAAIAGPLVAFNREAYGPSGSRSLALVLADAASGRRDGGLWARISYGWLYVELLSVPEQARGSGLGAALMRRAEAEARAHGCAGLWVDCFGARNRAFYERLGLETFGTLEGQPPGDARHFLKKVLA